MVIKDYLFFCYFKCFKICNVSYIVMISVIIIVVFKILLVNVKYLFFKFSKILLKKV